MKINNTRANKKKKNAAPKVAKDDDKADNQAKSKARKWSMSPFRKSTSQERQSGMNNIVECPKVQRVEMKNINLPSKLAGAKDGVLSEQGPMYQSKRRDF